MEYPEAYRARIEAQLGAEAADYWAALQQPAPVTLRVNRAKPTQLDALEGAEPLAGVSDGYRLAARPEFIFDPAWHAGAYYVQEASSMQVGEVVSGLLEAGVLASVPLRVLDRCAAPGGKTTHLLSRVPVGSLVVACEPGAARRHILLENLARWGAADVIVQSEPMGWSDDAFDLVVVDAPCSGEGLFRKQPEAVAEWSEAAVAHCAERQSRILDGVLPLVAPGGVLIYTTCTAAPAENGAQVARCLDTEQWQALAQPALEALGWQAVTDGKGLLGYQAWPHRVAGEGLFIAVLQRADGPTALSPSKKVTPALEPTKAGFALGEWLAGEWVLTASPAGLSALSPSAYALCRGALAQPRAFRADRMGLPLGEVKGRDVVPSHELALAQTLRTDTPRLELDREAALRYLKREAFEASQKPEPGWALVCYHGLGLGWVKALPNGRLNNYLPASWRIRKDLPDAQ